MSCLSHACIAQGIRAVRSSMIAPLHNFTLWQAPTNFLSFHPFSDGSWVLENFANCTFNAEVNGLQREVAARGWQYEWK